MDHVVAGRSRRPQRLHDRLTKLAAASGISVALIGAAHLLAWFTGFMAERGISTITMKTNTSLALLLSGTALVLLFPRQLGWVRHWAGRGCAALVLLIGALTLSEHLIGWDLGIDQLLAEEPPGAMGVIHPNRMGPPASSSFSLAGAALLLLSRRRGRVGALQWLAFGICLIALLSTLGYLYEIQSLYALARLTDIAWPTSLALLLLGLGLLCARPEQGMMVQVSAADPGGVTIRRLLLPALLLPVGLGWLRLWAERAGMYDTAMGTALLVLSFVVLFSVLVYQTGRRQSRFAAAERRAHEALLEKEERLRRVVEASPFPAIIHAEDGEIVMVNPAWSALTGYRHQDIPTVDAWTQKAHGECKPQIKAYIDTLYDLDRMVAEGEYVIRTANGGRRVWDFYSGPLGRDERGRRLVVSTAADITERKQAETALSEGEERFRLAAQAANDAIWDWNLETNRVTWNEAVTELFGYSEASAGTDVGWWEERIHPEERERVANDLHRAIHGDETSWQGEYRFRRADGSYAFVLDRGAVLRRPDGSAVRMVGAMLDLTARLEAEEALRSAKEAAEAGNRAKDRFLLIISHELRTPLTVIMGMLEMALREAGPTLRRYLEAAEKSSQMLLALIGDLLEISHIEKGGALLQEKVFDLPRCVQDALGHFPARARDKGLGLSLQVETGVPLKVFGDCGRLTQILEKLLDNAIRFTERGEVEVRVFAGEKSDGRRKVHLTVRDTGIGIPEEALGRIFDKFTQADESLTRRFGGAGLGLAISLALIEGMGGCIEVQSTPGEGSLFSIVIPFPVVEEAVSGERIQIVPAAAATRPFSILLGEDDPMISSLVRMILEREGWRVETAEDGRDVLEKWERRSFDLILMDLQMPRIDGLEATRIIRKREAGSETRIPIVALTAHARQEDEAICRQAGMDDFLTKPISMERLRAAVEKIRG